MKYWILLVFTFGVQTHAKEDIIFIYSHRQQQQATPTQVKKIFLKKSQTWSDGSKMRPIHRNIGAKSRMSLLKNYLEMSEIDLVEYWIESKQRFGLAKPMEVESNEMMMYVVANLQGSVGYVSAKYLEQTEKSGKNLWSGKFKVLKINQ